MQSDYPRVEGTYYTAMTMIYHFAFHQYYALQGLRIRGEERKPECEGISMMNEEHFSILNTYWKPLQPNYAIFHIISFSTGAMRTS